MAGRVAALGGGLVALAMLLACLAMWLVLDPLKYTLIEAQQQGLATGDAVRSALAGLSVGAWLLIGAAAAAAAAVAVAELRSAAISAAVAGGSRFATLAVLFAVLLWFGHSYLYGGHLLGGDTGAHIARVAHFADGLRRGELRYWDNSFYGGATFLQFTGPLFFWLAGAATLLVGDAVVATKLVLLGLHFAAGWGAYRLLRGFDLSRPAAAVGSIVYAGAFAHLHLLLYKGALPQALTLALLPVAFLAADRVAAAPRHFAPAWAALTLAVAALVVAHQPHGLVSGLYLAAYVAACFAFRRYPPTALWRFASASAAAALMASFSVVPWLVEGGDVMGSAAGIPVFWEWPDGGYLAKLLLWSNQWTSKGAASAAYLGLTAVALAVVAILGAGLETRDGDRRLRVAIFAALLLVSFGLRADYLRDVIFTLFFVALLAGFGAERVIAWRGGAPRLALAVLLLVFMDLGATAVQPLARRDKEYLDLAADYLSATTPPRRVVLMNGYGGAGDRRNLVTEIGPAAGPIDYYPVQTLFGPHNMAATRLHNYAVVTLKRVEKELRRDGRLSPATADLLAMLNVGRIVSDSGNGMGLPAGIAGTVEEGPLGRVLPIGDPTPAIFAPALVEIATPAWADRPSLWDSSFEQQQRRVETVDAVLDAVTTAMRFRPGTASAAVVPVLPGQEAISAPSGVAVEAAPGPALTVIEHSVEAQRIDMRLLLSSPGFVQLAHVWYAFQSITIDGQPVRALRGTLNLIVLPITAGEHVIEVTAERSPLRWAFGAGSGLVFILVLAVAARPSRRQSF